MRPHDLAQPHLAPAPSEGQKPEDRRACDTPVCPICAGRGVEKKQKWFCERCGQLLQTCCD